MKFFITLILAIAIFLAGALAFYALHIAITGDEPNYRVRGGAILIIVPWFIAAWIVRRFPSLVRESAVEVTRVGMRASKSSMNVARSSASSIIDEAKRREEIREQTIQTEDDKSPQPTAILK